MGDIVFNFQSGGMVVEDDSLYIMRKADQQIVEAIENNSKLICIFGPNQLGKTTMYYRTLKVLQSEDKLDFIYVNLQNIGTYEVTKIMWYSGLAIQICEKLRLPADEMKLLRSEYKENPEEFWRRFIESLSQLDKRIVIFFDDFDLVELLDFNLNDFFSPLEESSNKVSFVLAGVIAHHSIEKKAPKFSKMKKTIISLKDFKEHEIKDFEKVLKRYESFDTEKHINEIFKWTNGHPYMSQKIGERLIQQVECEVTSDLPKVDAIVEDLFFKKGLYSDVNLATCDRVFTFFFDQENNRDRRESALKIYETLLKEKSPLGKTELSEKSTINLSQNFDEILEDIRISGLIAIDEESNVKCRNEICRATFNESWIESKR